MDDFIGVLWDMGWAPVLLHPVLSLRLSIIDLFFFNQEILSSLREGSFPALFETYLGAFTMTISLSLSMVIYLSWLFCLSWAVAELLWTISVYGFIAEMLCLLDDDFTLLLCGRTVLVPSWSWFLYIVIALWKNCFGAFFITISFYCYAAKP